MNVFQMGAANCVPDCPSPMGSLSVLPTQTVDQHLRRVADGPGIADVEAVAAGRTGLGRHLIAGDDQPVVDAELRLAGVVVAEDVGQQIGVFRPHNLRSDGVGRAVAHRASRPGGW